MTETASEAQSSRSPWSLVLWTLAALPLLTGCHIPYAIVGHPKCTVARDLRGIKVEPDAANPDTILVSGGIFHSSWGISDMTLLRKKDAIVIQMHMKHAGFGRTNLIGEFSYRIHIPPDVNFVQIGKERQTIWSRPRSM